MANGGRSSKFNADVLKETDCNGDPVFSWCSPGFRAEEALCNFCNVTISCKHHGSAAIKRHATTAKHVAVCNKNRENGILKGCSQRRLDFSTPMANALCNCSHSDNVCAAEIKFTVALAVKDVPYSFADTANDMFSDIFFDSKIAKDYKCCRAKASYLISDGIGPYLKEKLIQSICESGSFYSIQVDETPIPQKRVQQMDVLVRYFNEESKEIIVQHLQSFHIGHGTAAKMFDCITDALEQLPQSKLFSFYSDGPNVMVSLKNKVKTVHPDLIDISTCSLHKVHNGFSRGLNSFGGDVETLLTDLYHFFKHSAAQSEDLKKFQNELGLSESVLLRHTSSRWLTLHSSITRFIEQFTALSNFFKKDTITRIDSARLKRIKEAFSDKSLFAKALFLQNVSQILNEYLELFQTEAPLIHILYDEMVKLVKQLMGRFLITSSFQKLSGMELKSIDMDKSAIWTKYVEIGADTIKALSSVTPNDKKSFYLGARSFYLTCTKYLVTSLPLENKMLMHLQVLHPNMRTESCSVRSIKFLAIQSPNVIKTSEVSLLRDEWIRLQGENLPSRSQDRIDHYWRDIFSICDNGGRKKYNYLSILVKALLSIPHGNADVERAFSINKLMLENRSNLTLFSINGIRQVKAYVSQVGRFHNFRVTPAIIKSAKGAYKKYSARMQKEIEVTEKRKINDEFLSKKIQLKKKEDELKGQLEASQGMLNTCEKNIEQGLKQKNMSMIEAGQVLLKESKSRMELYLKALEENRKEQALCIDSESAIKKKIKQK